MMNNIIFKVVFDYLARVSEMKIIFRKICYSKIKEIIHKLPSSTCTFLVLLLIAEVFIGSLLLCANMCSRRIFWRYNKTPNTFTFSKMIRTILPLYENYVDLIIINVLKLNATMHVFVNDELAQQATTLFAHHALAHTQHMHYGATRLVFGLNLLPVNITLTILLGEYG